MRLSKLQLMCLCGVLFVGILAGCSSNNSSDNTTSNDSASESEIPVVYKQNCLSCHGSELQGGIGPNLQKVGSRMSEEDLAQILRNGKGSMPAFDSKLNEEEITSLASWLSEQK